MPADRWGVEFILGTFAVRWVGKLSYSLYLGSWPALTIPSSIVLPAVTYAVVENPIRHSKWIVRDWWKSILLGLVIIGVVLLVATLEIHSTHTV